MEISYSEDEDEDYPNFGYTGYSEEEDASLDSYGDDQYLSEASVSLIEEDDEEESAPPAPPTVFHSDQGRTVQDQRGSGGEEAEVRHLPGGAEGGGAGVVPAVRGPVPQRVHRVVDGQEPELSSLPTPHLNIMNSELTELEFEFQSKASLIKRILRKPDSERIQLEASQLYEIIKKLPFFQKLLDVNSPDFQQVINEMGLETRERGQTVVQPGLPFTKLYLVLEGKVRLRYFDKKANREICKDLGPSSVIGELEFIFAEEQVQQLVTVSALSASLITISLRSLNSVPTNAEKLREMYKKLQSCSFFEDFSEREKKLIASRVDRTKFEMGERLIAQGSRIEHIYFFLLGKLRVMRKVELCREQALLLEEEPEPLKQKMHLEIDVLEEGDFIGVHEVLHKQTFENEVVTLSNGEYIRLNIGELESICPEYRVRIRHHIKKYPDDETILNGYRDQLRYEYCQQKSDYKVRGLPRCKQTYLRLEKELKQAKGLVAFAKVKKAFDDQALAGKTSLPSLLEQKVSERRRSRKNELTVEAALRRSKYRKYTETDILAMQMAKMLKKLKE